MFRDSERNREEKERRGSEIGRHSLIQVTYTANQISR